MEIDDTLERQRVHDDHRARELVAEFERRRGRRPTVMPDQNPGFDVASTDGVVTRRIEIKGLGGRWEDEATIHLTRRQFLDALGNKDSDIEYWLYVVDGLDGATPIIRTIRDVPSRGNRFYLQAMDWEAFAEESAITPHPPASSSPAEGWEDIEQYLDPVWQPLARELKRMGCLPPTEIEYEVTENGQVTNNRFAVMAWLTGGTPVLLVESGDNDWSEEAATFTITEATDPIDVLAWLETQVS